MSSYEKICAYLTFELWYYRVCGERGNASRWIERYGRYRQRADGGATPGRVKGKATTVADRKEERMKEVAACR